MNYTKEELKIKLEEHFLIPSNEILDRFNEEYEYYLKKNLIETLFNIKYLKNELEKKNLHPIIKGDLTYSLLAYILDIHNFCPLKNEISKEYGIFGFNFTQYEFQNGVNFHDIRFAFIPNEFNEGKEETIKLLESINPNISYIDYDSPSFIHIYVEDKNDLRICLSKGAFINEFHLLTNGKFNFKNKIKELVEEPIPDKDTLLSILSNESLKTLITKYGCTSNKELFRYITLENEESFENLNIEKVLTTREELYKELNKYLSKEESYEIVVNARKGFYKNDENIINYLIKKGLEKDKIEFIKCKYMPSLSIAIEVFLFYKALIYINNRNDKELDYNLLVENYEINAYSYSILDYIKRINNNLDNKLLKEQCEEKLYKALNKYYHKFFMDKKDDVIYLYTSLDEINRPVTNLSSIVICDISYVQFKLEEGVKVILNPNSLNYEIKKERKSVQH